MTVEIKMPKSKERLHHEPVSRGNAHRVKFLDQLGAFLRDRQAQAAVARKRFFQPDTSSREAYTDSVETYRKRFAAMLGWPLTDRRPSHAPPMRQKLVARDGLGAIYRTWTRTLPGLDTYGLLFLPPGKGPHALVISQHGGLGSPEIAAGFFNSANYNDMTRRVLRKGFAVYSPQTLLWRPEYGPKFNRQDFDSRLKQTGSSITAIELYQMQRCLDALVARADIDASRIGMIGLSYGGFYTLFLAAVDTRIRAAVSSCFFNDRTVYAGSDWTWQNAANTFLDAEIACLVAPRALYIEVGKKDELFKVATARGPARQVKQLYARLGIADRLQYREHKGGHELDKSPAPIEFLEKHLLVGNCTVLRS
jgi:dienelactone hydrolase